MQFLFQLILFIQIIVLAVVTFWFWQEKNKVKEYAASTKKSFAELQDLLLLEQENLIKEIHHLSRAALKDAKQHLQKQVEAHQRALTTELVEISKKSDSELAEIWARKEQEIAEWKENQIEKLNTLSNEQLNKILKAKLYKALSLSPENQHTVVKEILEESWNTRELINVKAK